MLGVLTVTPLALSLVLASASPPTPGGPPPDHGPFFAPEAPTESHFPSGPPPKAKPRFSLGQGLFCFVEDAQCKLSLLASIDVGIGVNIIAGDRGVDLPYAHYNFRGGLTLRPVTLIARRWHWWSVGGVVSWSRGTGTLASSGSFYDGDADTLVPTASTTTHRFALVNQFWLSQKRNAFHIDITAGLARSTVLTATSQLYNGTHLEVAAGWGGWGALFVSGDFLDGDARVITGFRGHGIATAPAVALILLGLLAGGAM